jgi:hypothetical protein
MDPRLGGRSAVVIRAATASSRVAAAMRTVSPKSDSPFGLAPAFGSSSTISDSLNSQQA